MAAVRARLLGQTERALRVLTFGFHAVMLMVALQGAVRLVTAPLSTTEMGVAGSATGAAIDIVLVAGVWVLGAGFLGASLAFLRRHRPPCLPYGLRGSGDAEEGWVPAPRSGPRSLRALR